MYQNPVGRKLIKVGHSTGMHTRDEVVRAGKAEQRRSPHVSLFSGSDLLCMIWLLQFPVTTAILRRATAQHGAKMVSS
jgi:hypothetical protein